MKPDSEICLRVAIHLAQLADHGSIKDSWCPDDPEHTREAQSGEQFIDLIAIAADDTMIALEHTTIESYTRQLHDFRQIESLLRPLEGQLVGQLPTDRTYVLAVGMGAVADKTLDPTEVQSSVAAWIIATAPTLPAGSPQSAPLHQAYGEPPTVPVEIVLSARAPYGPSGEDGRLLINRFGDSDAATMMNLRVERLRVALRMKLPKLLARAPARTVLVLEDPDLAMSNIFDVWVALQRAAEGLALCDTIVVVETWTSPIIGTIVFDAGEWLEDLNSHSFPLPQLTT